MSNGEIYLGQHRAGLETTYGTAVVPTLRLYLNPDSGMTPGGSTTRNSVQTGNRAQVRSAVPGVSEPSGSFSLPVESAEILPFLHTGLNGSPVITTPTGSTLGTRLHTYTGPGTLASMTQQFHDGALPWQQAGVHVANARIAGTANGDNLFSGDTFAATHTQTALSGTVTERAPTPYSGYETTLAIDSVSGTDNYGTTIIAAGQSVISWDLPVAENNLGRLYTAANTRAMQAAITGVYEATGSMTFKASGARALTEYNDFVAGTQKRVRFMFGNNITLEGTLKSFVSWDCQIVWTEFNLLGEEAGVRTYEGSFGYVYDVTSSLAVRIRCQNQRLTAF